VERRRAGLHVTCHERGRRRRRLGGGRWGSSRALAPLIGRGRERRGRCAHRVWPGAGGGQGTPNRRVLPRGGGRGEGHGAARVGRSQWCGDGGEERGGILEEKKGGQILYDNRKKPRPSSAGDAQIAGRLPAPRRMPEAEMPKAEMPKAEMPKAECQRPKAGKAEKTKKTEIAENAETAENGPLLDHYWTVRMRAKWAASNCAGTRATCPTVVRGKVGARARRWEEKKRTDTSRRRPLAVRCAGPPASQRGRLFPSEMSLGSFGAAGPPETTALWRRTRPIYFPATSRPWTL
jgi:hypothetical protein